jgi:hypothetical protein
VVVDGSWDGPRRRTGRFLHPGAAGLVAMRARPGSAPLVELAALAAVRHAAVRALSWGGPAIGSATLLLQL